MQLKHAQCPYGLSILPFAALLACIAPCCQGCASCVHDSRPVRRGRPERARAVHCRSVHAHECRLTFTVSVSVCVRVPSSCAQHPAHTRAAGHRPLPRCHRLRSSARHGPRPHAGEAACASPPLRRRAAQCERFRRSRCYRVHSVLPRSAVQHNMGRALQRCSIEGQVLCLLLPCALLVWLHSSALLGCCLQQSSHPLSAPTRPVQTTPPTVVSARVPSARQRQPSSHAARVGAFSSPCGRGSCPPAPPPPTTQ